jgi:HEAT repeat protein
MNRCWNTFAVATALTFVVLSTRAADDAADKIAAAIRTAQTRQDTDPADALNYLAGEVIAAAKDKDAAKKKAMEQLLIAGLAGAKTRASKDFFCRQFVMIGSEAAVPELAKLLTDPESAHISRYALARIPGPAADAALLEALSKADDKQKIGLVSSLGTRGCAAAVDKIVPLVTSSNRELTIAAVTALGRIDSPAAVAAVAQARQIANLQVAATDAYLNCAARLVKQGRAAEAITIYQKLFAPQEPSACRVAALIGLVGAQPEQSVATVMAALADQDAKVRRAAAATLRYVPGAAATQAIVAAFAGKEEDTQVLLLSVLADRGDAAALPTAVRTADAASPAVRIAALTALGALGNGSVVPLLAQRAATAAETGEHQAARASLNRLAGNTINGEIARQLGAELPAVRIEAAKALAARNAADQVTALFRAAEDKETAVAAEVLKSLRTLATGEQLPALVKLQLAVKDAGVRGEAENTVVVVAATVAKDANPAATALAALPGAAEPVARASLVRVLGRIGHASALPALNEAVQDNRPEVKDAGIRALAEWPTADPIKVLRGIADDSAASLTHRVLALRGFINQIAKQPQASDTQILDDYAHAIQTASRNEEKQFALSKLALVRHRRALEMARGLAGEPTLRQSADAAVQSIEKLLAAPARVTASVNPEKVGNAIDKDPATRWDTGGAQAGGEWFRIELDEERTISGIVLDSAGSGGDYPRGYEVYVSASSLGDGQLVAKGKGTEAVVKIKFDKPVRGKAIKIVQTGQAQGLFWSIHELTVESQP